MSITADDYERLLAAGFIKEEIDIFANATVNQYDMSSQKPINLNLPVWQDVMEDRVRWIRYFRDQGESDEEIYERILKRYKRARPASPYDFIKAKYGERKRMDYIAASRRRARRRLQRSGMAAHKRR